MRRRKYRSKAHRLCFLSLMCALALIIFIVEAQIPVPVAIPGLKLGLANVITLYMLSTCGVSDAFIVLILRIALGSIFAGQAVSLIYSLCGGLLAFAAMTVFLKLSRGENVWFAGVLGAVMHNVGQIAAAVVMYGTLYVAYYLAVLTFCAVATGLLTGITAQLLTKRHIEV